MPASISPCWRRTRCGGKSQRRPVHHHGIWHRTPIPDLLIAEIALYHDLGVVHIDGDFARIADVRPAACATTRLDARLVLDSARSVGVRWRRRARSAPKRWPHTAPGARQRQQAEREALAAREERAWALARRAAAELRRRFGADRVVVFGSLVHPGCFTPWSDVDVAAWGLRPEDTFRAIGMAMDLDPDIPVNLVDVGACKAAVLESIERDGVPL